MAGQTWTYQTSPVAWAFRQSRSFASVVIGPVGPTPGWAEYWSPDGWRRLDQHRQGDVALVADPKTGRTHFEPTGHVVGPAPDGFIQLENRSGTTRIIADATHGWPVKSKGGVLRTMTTGDLAARAGSVNNAQALFRTFKAPQTAGLPYTDDELRLIVAVCADGHIRDRMANRKICICIRKQRKKDRLRRLLAKTSTPFRHRTYSQRPTEDHFDFDPPLLTKRLRDLRAGTPHQLRVIFDELWHWDGFIDKYGQRRFSTTDAEDADFVEWLVSACGYRAAHSIETRSEGWRSGHAPLHKIAANRKGVLSSIDNLTASHVPSEDGLKYCLTTSTGFFVIRMGRGQVFITANSGKSVPLLQRVLEHGREQEPSPDGIRRSRFALVRNTMPELRSTTAVTYDQIYPAEHFGDVIWRSPATHNMKVDDIEVEVNLIALDKPKDVKKLLSLELTGAAFNEMREVPRSVVTRMTERVGRYALNERATTWRGIWGDSNPPDTDHWLYDWHHQNRPMNYEFFQQPPGVLEVKPVGNGAEIIDENFPEYAGTKLTSAVVMAYVRRQVQRVECPIEIIPAADRFWIVNPWMENLAALSRVSAGSNPLGSSSYYGQALAGKGLEEIQSYLQGVYTFVLDGRRVVPQYNAQVHGVDDLPVMADVEINVGMDIGGGTLQPSALIFQKHPRGVFLAHREVVCFDMGVKRFGELLSETLVTRFPQHVERGLVGTMWGDPAGVKRDEIFETASFDYLRTTHGFKVEPAPSQDPKMRIAALAAPCERMIDGKPGVLINKRGCPMLHKGLMGGWHYKRMAISGEERFADRPNKNEFSHICDAGGYGFLGAGEFAMLGGRTGHDTTPMDAEGDFDL